MISWQIKKEKSQRISAIDITWTYNTTTIFNEEISLLKDVKEGDFAMDRLMVRFDENLQINFGLGERIY